MGLFDFSIASSDDKLPLVTLGYDKVYYGYSVSDEEWYVHNTKEINEKISVEYFDLSTLKKKTEKLDLYAISSLYDVSFRFEYGYCKIVNGKIIVNSNAPHKFKDILYVSFKGKTNTLNRAR